LHRFLFFIMRQITNTSVCNQCDSNIFHEMALNLSGWKAPGWGRKRTKIPYVIPEQQHLVSVFGSRFGAQPAFNSAWTNAGQFADWQARQKADSPGRTYKYSQDQDFDGDDVNEGIVRDGSGQIIGMNGYRVNKPSTWAKNVGWLDPDGGYGRREYVYKQRKAYNESDGVNTLAGLRKQFYELVIKPLYAGIPKGDASRKVPRMSIASFVMNRMGGYNIDSAWLAENSEAIQEAGGSPESALAQFHRTKTYRDALIQVLTPVVNGDPNGEKRQQAAALGLQYVRQWVEAHPQAVAEEPAPE
jgi:hypothetical protein